MALTLFTLIRTAWISDDAAISLRTVLNFINGYGPVFNVGERVQAYTHPLWFFVISGLTWITGNVFYSSFALSIAASLAVIWLLITRVANTIWAGVFAAAIVLFSKAYSDYSTSGLENPLSHLLLVGIAIVAAHWHVSDSEKRFKPLCFFFILCGLLLLNRHDLALLAAPLALYVMWESRSQLGALLMAMTIGAVPIILWEAFSLFYYGIAVPNTAYAKLGAGISKSELIQQGWLYYANQPAMIPVTMAANVIGSRLIESA